MKEVRSISGASQTYLKSVEKLFNETFGEKFTKYDDAETRQTVYQVPEEREAWWRFWLAAKGQ